jgi:O-antigen/teichoic acid export membrane protein
VSVPRRISTNAVYQLLAQAGVLVLNLVASPVIVRGLGLEAYGLLVLVGITTNYFGFVELGLGRATIQLLAQHRARGEAAELRQVFWTAAGAYLVLGLVGAAALVGTAPLMVRHVLAISPGAESQALRAFVIGAAGLVIAMQRDVASSVATAMERFDLVSRVTLGVGAVQTAVNVGLVLSGVSLVGVMVGGLAVQTVALALYWALAFVLIPDLRPPEWSGAKLRGLLRFGGYVTISQVVAPLLVHIEKILIGALATVEQLPYYALPYNLAWALTSVPTALGNVIYPAMSRLLAQGDEAGVRETFRRATRFIYVVVLGPVVLLALLAPQILTAWMGAAFAEKASACLRLLAVAVLVNVVAWPAYQLLHAAGRADRAARFHLVELILHVPASLFLISRAGVVGAAVAWLLRVLLDTGLLVRAGAEVAGLSVGSLARECLGRGTLAAVALLPLPLVARTWFPGGGRTETIVLLGVLGLVYVLPAAWLGLSREERSAVLAAVRSVLTGARPAPAGS